MTWSLVYAGTHIASGLSLDSMQSISDQILSCYVNNSVVWYDVQHPAGDGIGFTRLLFAPGIPVAFTEDDNSPARFGAAPIE